MADRPQRLGLDRVDQRAHPGVRGAGGGDAFGIALAALGGVLDRAALGDVDDFTAEQRVALGGQSLGLGEFGEGGDGFARQMGLGPVEMDTRHIQAERGQPVGIIREKIEKRGLRERFDRRPVGSHDACSFLDGPGWASLTALDKAGAQSQALDWYAVAGMGCQDADASHGRAAGPEPDGL